MISISKLISSSLDGTKDFHKLFYYFSVASGKRWVSNTLKVFMEGKAFHGKRERL